MPGKAQGKNASSKILNHWFSGYFFMSQNFRDNFSILREFMVLFFPLALWVVANWCFTTLMDGEGSMKDVAVASAYALFPFTLINFPIIIITNFITSNEAALFFTLQGVAIFWCAFLFFAGTIVTHQYTIMKAIFAIFLSILGMFILLLLIFIIVCLLQQVYMFGMTLWQEVTLRWL